MTPSEARDELLLSEAISAVQRADAFLEDHLDEHSRFFAINPEERALMQEARGGLHALVVHLKARAMGPLASEMSNRNNAEMEAA